MYIINSKYSFLKCFLLFLAVLSFDSKVKAQATTIVELNIPILSGNDDVEQLNSGEMYLNSTDIELTDDPDNGGEQIVGLRFQNIQLLAGADITDAYIQFQTDEVSTGTCNLQIHAEASANPTNFGSAFYDLSNRTLTTQMTEWTPVTWPSPQQAGLAQRSPDLSNIIQEITNLPNWSAGNSINFIISGTGSRIAHAYESNPSYVARLVIELNIPIINGDLSNIYINELMAKNNIVLDEYGEADDWIELYNANDTAVLIQSLYLSDDAADKTKWQIEEPLIIPPHGFQLFWLDDTPEQGGNHVPFKLSSSGESLFLSQEQAGDLVQLDAITFGAIPQNVSYGRQTDGATSWVHFGEYSPNASNNDNSLHLNATIEFSIPSGFYQNGTQLTITCDDPDAQIRYTSDGSMPSETTLLYTGPISLNQTTLIKAAAFKAGFASSTQKDGFYHINNSHEIPVINLSIDPKYLWDNQKGMYVIGTNGLTGNCAEDPVNWNQDWERPALVRYFEPDGTPAFELDAGMKIAGGCSRNYPMKSFNLFFRDNKIEYPLFSTLDIDEFKRFKLRNSGNDFPFAMVRDATVQSLLHEQSDIDLMAYEPVVVYLNGAYWGVYGLREFYNKHYVESHHGVNKDSLDLIKNPYVWSEIKEGDDIAWDQLTNYIRNNALSNSTHMDHVASQIDLNEFMNYNIAQIYIANYDWPANNVAVWRNRNNDGKWRWMLYDTDICCGFGFWSPSEAEYNMIGHSTTSTGQVWPNGEASTLFLRKILSNQAFEEEFTQRTCTFAQTVFAPDRTKQHMDSLTARIHSEIPAFVDAFENAPWEWKLWGDAPVGGSYNSWQTHINKFQQFFVQRLDYLLSNYKYHFNYDGDFRLKINCDETSNGRVVLHENEMRIPYQYEGQYFRNVPILIKAIPDEGYSFVRWNETGDTNAVIHYSSNQQSMLTPIFRNDDTGEENPPPDPEIVLQSLFEVYPVPASDALTLKFSERSITKFTVRIYNSIGQLVYIEGLAADVLAKEHVIDVSGWATGVYFLETMIKDEEIVMKIMVQ